jgi:hypothetical protein
MHRSDMNVWLPPRLLVKNFEHLSLCVGHMT